MYHVLFSVYCYLTVFKSFYTTEFNMEAKKKQNINDMLLDQGDIDSLFIRILHHSLEHNKIYMFIKASETIIGTIYMFYCFT